MVSKDVLFGASTTYAVIAPHSVISPCMNSSNPAHLILLWTATEVDVSALGVSLCLEIWEPDDGVTGLDL